jgi:cytochrome o ubiquinol oxidase subunit 1
VGRVTEHSLAARVGGNPMGNEGIWGEIFGRLNWQSISFVVAAENPTTSELIGAGAGTVFVLGAAVSFGLITWFGLWRQFWNKWLTSTDHKRIGIMYIVLAIIMLTRGVIEGALMRLQQADGLDGGFLASQHFAELFSTHGTIMVFFVAMPFVTGFINYLMPLQIGARDVSFPVMNQISLGLTTAAAGLIMISLVLGKFSTGGWSAYPPYTGAEFNPGVGPDYWIWTIVIAGIGSTLSGINFAVTIYKERAPGMSLFRMPLFTWTALCASVILIFAMPPLTVAALMLALDRYMDFHFFTNDLGGNMMLFANMFWLFGHPEVYLLVLPAYGIYSEVVATYSGKRLYGYKSLVYATMSIAVLSFTVWLHHFFTMGQSANVNIVFGIASMLIGVPTGVKVYDWMATMFRGRVRFSVPMVYTTGFFILFVIGGLTGIILANPTIDYQVHNTLFLIAHFHNVLIPGVLFAMLAGYHYWFPKAFGFRLSEKWGYITASLWVFGFSFAFLPLYVVGLMGMPRRSVSYTDPSFVPFLLVSGFGAALLLSALSCLLIQLRVSIRDRDKARVAAGDPWNGRTLEWSISSPPPEYNFAVVPQIESLDAFADAKAKGTAYNPPESYEDIEVPRNTSIGVIMLIGGMLLGLGLVWYMWWLAVLSFLVVIGAFIARTFMLDTTKIIPAEEVAREHKAWLQLVADTPPVTRDQEARQANGGVAVLELPEAAS